MSFFHRKHQVVLFPNAVVISHCTLFYSQQVIHVTDSGPRTTPPSRFSHLVNTKKWNLQVHNGLFEPPPVLSQPPPRLPRAACCWGCTNSPAPSATPPFGSTKAAFTSTFWWPSEGNVVVAGWIAEVQLCISRSLHLFAQRVWGAGRNVRCSVRRYGLTARLFALRRRWVTCAPFNDFTWRWHLFFLLLKVLKSNVPVVRPDWTSHTVSTGSTRTLSYNKPWV